MINYIARIECDGDGHEECPYSIEGSIDDTHTDVIKEAQRKGWKIDDGLHICPDCQKHNQQE